jgi:hypothetical protein
MKKISNALKFRKQNKLKINFKLFLAITMSVIARLINRNVVNKTRFYRQIFITSNQSRKEDFKDNSKNFNGFWITAAGIASSIVGYGLFKDYFSPLVPSVLAATPTTSRRAQVRNFILKDPAEVTQILILVQFYRRCR